MTKPLSERVAEELSAKRTTRERKRALDKALVKALERLEETNAALEDDENYQITRRLNDAALASVREAVEGGAVEIPQEDVNDDDGYF